MEKKRQTRYIELKVNEMYYSKNGARLIPRTKMYPKGDDGRIAIIDVEIPNGNVAEFHQRVMNGEEIKKFLDIEGKDRVTIS